MKISHSGQRGWGSFPSSIINIVSCMWQCTKGIRRLVLIVACPLQASTGHLMEPYALWKDTLYQCDRWCYPFRVPLLPLLVLVMGYHQPHCELQLTLWTPKYLPLPLMKGCTHAHHASTYTPPPSDHQQCCMDDTPYQPVCLQWSVGPPCRTVPSRHPVPLGSGLAWARQEGRHQHKIMPSLA